MGSSSTISGAPSKFSSLMSKSGAACYSRLSLRFSSLKRPLSPRKLPPPGVKKLANCFLMSPVAILVFGMNDYSPIPIPCVKLVCAPNAIAAGLRGTVFFLGLAAGMSSGIRSVCVSTVYVFYLKEEAGVYDLVFFILGARVYVYFWTISFSPSLSHYNEQSSVSGSYCWPKSIMMGGSLTSNLPVSPVYSITTIISLTYAAWASVRGMLVEKSLKV